MKISYKDCIFKDEFQRFEIEYNPIEGPYIKAIVIYNDFGKDMDGERQFENFECTELTAYDDDGNGVHIPEDVIEQFTQIAEEEAGKWK